MLDRLPHLHTFSRSYWHQMGDVVYGTIDNAFRQFLDDASRLPDGGMGYRRALLQELMLASGAEYARWVTQHRTHIPTIKALGGAFIMPSQVPSLLSVLNENSAPDA
jgi:hypothetical protein